MSQPLLSVTVANFNHGRFLRKCFAGLLAQSFTDFELLITDDGSTDGSQDIIREYAAKDSRIRPHFCAKCIAVCVRAAALFLPCLSQLVGTSFRMITGDSRRQASTACCNRRVSPISACMQEETL